MYTMSESVGATAHGNSLSEVGAKIRITDNKGNDEGEEEIIVIAEDLESKSKLSQSQLLSSEFNTSNSTSLWEIEEECFESGTADVHLIGKRIINTNGVGMGSLASIREQSEGCSLTDDEDVVYVGVGKGNSSMDALVWTLNNIAINSSDTIVFLIHVFPEIRFIPTPLGKLPISQVNLQQKESYLNQEKTKRGDFLQKFLDLASSSKVKVDTVLIESNMEAKALLDLIPILNIRKLVLGTSKSSLRKLRSRKGNGIVDQVLENVPGFCDVKIICEGKVVDTMAESPSPSSPSASQSPRAAVAKPTQTTYDEPNKNSFGCVCFKSKVIR